MALADDQAVVRLMDGGGAAGLLPQGGGRPETFVHREWGWGYSAKPARRGPQKVARRSRAGLAAPERVGLLLGDP